MISAMEMKSSRAALVCFLLMFATPTPLDSVTVFLEQEGKRVLFVEDFSFLFLSLNDVVGQAACFYFMLFLFLAALGGGWQCLSLGCGVWGRCSSEEQCEQMLHPVSRRRGILEDGAFGWGRTRVM